MAEPIRSRIIEIDPEGHGLRPPAHPGRRPRRRRLHRRRHPGALPRPRPARPWLLVSRSAAGQGVVAHDVVGTSPEGRLMLKLATKFAPRPSAFESAYRAGFRFTELWLS